MPNLTDINSLSGPDAIVNVPASANSNATANKYVGLLSGSDAIQRVAVGQVGIGTISRTTGGSVSGGTIIAAGGIGNVIPFNGNTIVASGSGTTPDYTFSGTMSEQVMHNYLDRIVEMQYINSPWYSTGVSPAEVVCAKNMIIDVGAKFVTATAGFWDSYSDANLDSMCTLAQSFINDLHAIDPDIIFEGSVAENVDGSVRGVSFPTGIIFDGMTLLELFGQTSHIVSTGANPAYFDNIQMVYGPPYSGNTPDITRVETQMFWFYLITRYIDIGCESISFSDFWNQCINDSGHVQSWNLFSLIRAYGRTRNRGVVLLTAHTWSSEVYKIYYPGATTAILASMDFYYRPSGSTLPSWQCQLLLDFHSAPMYINGYSSPGSPAPYDGVGFGDGYYPLILEYGASLMNNLLGGLNPQGWYCTVNPYYLNFDWDGMGFSCWGAPGPCPEAGTWGTACSSVSKTATPSNYNYCLCNISWFVANQPAYRDLILKYMYYRIKCLDPYNAHLAFPGRMVNVYPAGSASLNPSEPNTDFTYYFYGAYANWANIYGIYPSTTPPGPNQQLTITGIFNGSFAGPSDWVHHNFTTENVADGPDIGPASSLIFVTYAGTNLMFYIGTDNYIHGYVQINSNYKNGTWLTVSPSYAAQVPASSQVPAKSGLVASPDGATLLYIDIDGYIRGFNILDVWTYQYFDFMKDQMVAQNITANCCLIYPTSNSIYYIGTYTPDNSNAVQGFQNSSGIWNTVSPTYSAIGNGQTGLAEPEGRLAYDGIANRIYYTDLYGLLYYFQVNSLIDYFYVVCPGNALLNTQKLQIASNLAIYNNGTETRLYYVGHYYGGTLPEGQYWIHCLIESGSSWNTVSPSYSALDAGQPMTGLAPNTQSPPIFGQVAVSLNGNTIAYFGSAQTICYYSYLGGSNYYFNNMPYLNFADVAGDNSLQFTSNEDLYYTDQLVSFSVHHYKFEEDFCENPAIADWPLPPVLPTAEAVDYGGNWYIRLTFSVCSDAVCNAWTLNFMQTNPVPHPDSGTQIVTVNCSALPYIIDVPIHPDFVLHGYEGFIYEYTIVSCNDVATSGTVTG